MLDAALFWVDNLWTDERDGTLVANPSHSPEHGEFSLGCSTSQAMICEMFGMMIKASKEPGKGKRSGNRRDSNSHEQTLRTENRPGRSIYGMER